MAPGQNTYTTAATVISPLQSQKDLMTNLVQDLRMYETLVHDPYSLASREKNGAVLHLANTIVLYWFLTLPSIYITRIRTVLNASRFKGRHRFTELSLEEGITAEYNYLGWEPHMVAVEIRYFHHAWGEFIANILRECKTFNIISSLLTTGILTLFQISDVAGNAISKTAAEMSIICALMSLIFGSAYIFQFGTMLSIQRALIFVQTSTKAGAFLLWNIWILLATPGIWLAWSLIFFVVTILSYIWATGVESLSEPIASDVNRALQIIVTIPVVLGFTALIAIVVTFSSWRGIKDGGVMQKEEEQLLTGNGMERGSLEKDAYW